MGKSQGCTRSVEGWTEMAEVTLGSWLVCWARGGHPLTCVRLALSWKTRVLTFVTWWCMRGIRTHKRSIGHVALVLRDHVGSWRCPGQGWFRVRLIEATAGVDGCLWVRGGDCKDKPGTTTPKPRGRVQSGWGKTWGHVGPEPGVQRACGPEKVMV